MNHNPDQFTFTGTGNLYRAVVTRIDFGQWHWQVIQLSTGRIVRQAETEGVEAQTRALQYALDALKEFNGGRL